MVCLATSVGKCFETVFYGNCSSVEAKSLCVCLLLLEAMFRV